MTEATETLDDLFKQVQTCDPVDEGSDLFQDPYVAAAELGLDVVLPDETQLFIDLDDAKQLPWLNAMLAVIHSNGFNWFIEKTTESVGGNHHVYIRTDCPITDAERIALQAAMGSDRKRELLGVLRLILPRCEGHDGKARAATTFFEKKAQA